MAAEQRLPVFLVTTGTANLGSITAALTRAGGDVTLTLDPEVILSADHVVVPGVGTFGQAMEAIHGAGVREALFERFSKNLPTMWVCVGLQLCASTSEESPGVKGLEIFGSDTKVLHFPTHVHAPQQGWNRIWVSPESQYAPKTKLDESSGCMEAYAYFSNSYALHEIPKGWVSMTSLHGIGFVAALERGAFLACQLHPELSGDWGLQLVTNWLRTSKSRVGLFASDAHNYLPQPTPERPSTLTRRVIPCLDVKDGKVVKGIKFQGLQEAGSPATLSAQYQADGADELVMLDVSATLEGRNAALFTIRAIRAQLGIPLTVGGGIKTIEDAAEILKAGADKVSVNSAAVRNPGLITALSQWFGRQCTVLAIDAVQVKSEDPNALKKWQVVISSGKENTGKDVVEWATEGANLGAGEILLTSFDRDGTKSGYDLELLSAVARAVHVPVIASGGAADTAHLAEALRVGSDAVLAASIFHYGQTTPRQVKTELSGEFRVRH
jgi:imidazole glycerol phosphate synthase glutamine amidotransferase subunit